MREAAAAMQKALPMGGSGISGAYGGRIVCCGLAKNFLCAGSSAFLLLAANLFLHCWYFSFFALIPFLYRTLRVDAKNSFFLGLFFGLSFFSVLKLDGFLIAPVSTALTISFGTALFAVFGWGVACAKEKFGFNPLFVALFWILFELVLVKVTHTDLNAGANLQVRPFGFFHGLSVLFGFLAVSFVIVLVNSLLVFVIDKTISLAKARGQGVWENGSVWDLTSIPGLLAQKVYFIPSVRSPPVCSI